MRGVSFILAIGLTLCSVSCVDRGPAPPGFSSADAGPTETPCSTQAVLVSYVHSPWAGFLLPDDWQAWRSHAEAVPDGAGGLYVAFRTVDDPRRVGTTGFQRQSLERYGQNGSRLWGTPEVPLDVCPAAALPANAHLAPDGAGGVFMNLWVLDPTFGQRRPQVQRIGEVGEGLWSTDSPGCGRNVQSDPGGFITFPWTLPTGDLGLWLSTCSGRACLFGIEYQVMSPGGTPRWPSARHVIDGVTADLVPFASEGGAWILGELANAPGVDLRVQRISPDGDVVYQPDGILIADHVYSNLPWHWYFDDGQGGVLVIWGSATEPLTLEPDSWPEYLYAARVAADGSLPWGRGVPLSTTLLYRNGYTTHHLPYGAPDGNGGLIAGWWEDRDGDGQSECYGQHVAPNGALAFGENGILLGAGADAICQTPTTSIHYLVAHASDGAVVVVLVDGQRLFFDEPARAKTPWRLRLQKIGPGLEPLWGSEGVTLMDCPDLGPVHDANSVHGLDWVEHVLPDSDGGAYVLWSTGIDAGNKLWLQHVSSDGRISWVGNR